MPKSHKRGGAKAHNKRVAARNAKIKNQWKEASKAAWETFAKMKEEKNNENQNNSSIRTSTESDGAE
jgi:hypothetical protein